MCMDILGQLGVSNLAMHRLGIIFGANKVRLTAVVSDSFGELCETE